LAGALTGGYGNPGEIGLSRSGHRQYYPPFALARLCTWRRKWPS
jgi:hypothetical protein